jgi:N-carbamoylputrescine amidase
VGTTIRVAAIQMESRDGQIEANLKHATSLVNDAAAKGAKLILLPEFMPTGYTYTRAIWDAAEPGHGPTVQWLLENSRKLGVWMGASFLEAEGEDFYNTFVLATPDGKEAGRVRKQTPAGWEAYFFKGDRGPHTVSTELGRIGVGICYENSLAYIPRLMYEASADLVLMPHSAPLPPQIFFFHKKRMDAYNEELKETPHRLAFLLGVPVVMANKSGRWQTSVSTPPFPHRKIDSTFPGFSAIVDSDGNVKRQLGDLEGIILEDVTLDASRKTPAQPACHGRWAWRGRWSRNSYMLIEACGRLSYSLSSERRRKALRVSSSSNRQPT